MEIPTAEEVLTKFGFNVKQINQDFAKAMIEFAKLHCQRQAEVIAAWTYHTVTVISERDDDVILGIKSVSEVPPYKNVCGEDFSTYEQAQLAGIKTAVELIKQKKQ